MKYIAQFRFMTATGRHPSSSNLGCNTHFSVVLVLIIMWIGWRGGGLCRQNNLSGEQGELYGLSRLLSHTCCINNVAYQ
jgi:hypothetical protein